MVDPVQAEEDDPYLYRLVRAILEMSRWWTLSRLRKLIPTSRLVRTIREMSRWWTLSRLRKLISTSRLVRDIREMSRWWILSRLHGEGDPYL
jgi:hypothetical protein